MSTPETPTEQTLRAVAESKRRHGQEFAATILTAEADDIDRGRQAIAEIREFVAAYDAQQPGLQGASLFGMRRLLHACTEGDTP